MEAPNLTRGRLEQLSLPGLFRPLVRAKKTGLIRFTRGKTIKTVYISQGKLIFATSTDPDDRLGEMLLRKGLITYQALEESVRGIQAGKRQGTLLVQSGAIRSKDLIEGVAEQVQEIIYSLFRWEEGEYEFAEGDLPAKEVIVIRMSTSEILMEGIRRIEAWSRIRQGAGSLDQQYMLAPDAMTLMGDMSLTKDEVSLIACLDGVMTLEEICAAAHQMDFVVCRTVWGLWATGFLDRIPQDRGSPTTVRDKTDPHAERMRGASMGREVDRFNEVHRFLFELVSYELREQARDFFEKAFTRANAEEAVLFEGVAVDESGELNSLALRRNILTHEIASYVRGLERLLEIETEMAREMMGERKAAIIRDGILSLKERQQSGAPSA